MIPYACPDINQDDISAVIEVLRTDWLTQGPVVPRFERAVVDYCQAGFGVAVSSATAALHLACLALQVGPGSRVWTSPNTFVASANCARYCGAEVDFVDIDAETGNLSVLSLSTKLVIASQNGTLPQVLVVVHFAGQACEMAEIARLAQQYGFKVIEDASHALGACYQGEPVGNCRFSDITVFSFHAVKLVACGEGGMACCKDPALAERMRLLRSHGVTREHGADEAWDGPWYYQQQLLGFNYRMTEMQAALGLSQLARLPQFLQQRRQLVAQYTALLGSGAVLPLQTPEAEASAWHLYVVRCRDAEERRYYFEQLRVNDIAANVHYIPVYWQPYYCTLGFERGYCLQAELYYATALTLPLHTRLGTVDVEQIVSVLNSGEFA